MNSSAATSAYARGIYNAFAAYKKKHSGNITVPYLPEPQEEKKVELPQIVPQTAKEEEAKPIQAPEPAPVPEPANTTEELANVDLSVVPESQPAAPAETPKAEDGKPVFKVQFLASSSKLKTGDSRFKGMTGIDSYKEDGMVKYTVGASTDYNEIYRLRKSIIDKFPQAFIIAFKNGSKMNVQEAIREFKNRKK